MLVGRSVLVGRGRGVLVGGIVVLVGGMGVSLGGTLVGDSIGVSLGITGGPAIIATCGVGESCAATSSGVLLG